MIGKLSDKNLLSEVGALVEKERQTTEQILNHLQEIHRRRLYADLGYSSLYKYLVRGLGYSEGAAARRVGALNLVYKVPEAKAMIGRGELNLTVANATHRFTKAKNREDTRNILARVKNKTKDEVDLEFLKIEQHSSAKPRELKNRVNDSQMRIHITVANKTVEKLDQLKAIKKMSTDQALDHSLDCAFTAYEKSLKRERRAEGARKLGPRKATRAIPMDIRRAVLLRAESQCEFQGCDERRNLEFEHIKPYAFGGDSTLDNIRLFCRTHNQRAAIKSFGQEKMDQYLRAKGS